MMGPVVHWLVDPFAYAFMQRALLEVILMGAVTGAIGTYVVLRGLSFIGDALSHAIFPGVVIAFLLGRSVFLGALAFGLLTSISIVVLATTATGQGGLGHRRPVRGVVRPRRGADQHDAQLYP